MALSFGSLLSKRSILFTNDVYRETCLGSDYTIMVRMWGSLRKLQLHQLTASSIVPSILKLSIITD